MAEVGVLAPPVRKIRCSKVADQVAKSSQRRLVSFQQPSAPAAAPAASRARQLPREVYPIARGEDAVSKFPPEERRVDFVPGRPAQGSTAASFFGLNDPGSRPPALETTEVTCAARPEQLLRPTGRLPARAAPPKAKGTPASGG